MLQSYVATAVRHLVSQKLYSAINLVGLAVALAAAMLAGLFVRHELSYDRYHANAERVYRVSNFFTPPGAATLRGVGAPPLYAPLLEADFPEIEDAARISGCGRSTVITSGDSSYPEPFCASADSEIFRLFDFVWLAGDAATALRDPYSIVLTETSARKYFGTENAVGRTLTVNGGAPVAVTGVIRDLPDNTHLRFDMLLAMGYLAAVNGNAMLESPSDNSFHVYVMLRPGAGIDGIRSGSKAFLARHRGEDFAKMGSLEIVPITAIHLSPPFGSDMRPPGSVEAVYASAGIAALIVLIACINFVNLATAGARRRAKEVGVRKVVGASRLRVVAQFIGESLLLATLAAAIALAIVELTLPAFGAFMQRDLSFDYRSNPDLLAAVAAVTLLVALAAGSFPAFYLAAFEPARVLKGDATRGRSAVLLRSTLVGFQFAISIALVIATAIVHRQFVFMRDIDLGYDKEQIVVVSDGRTGRLAERWEVLRREWLADPGIVAATASGDAPGVQPRGKDFLRAEGADPESQAVNMNFLTVDFDFFATYDIAVVAGRAFSRDSGMDSADVELQGFAESSVAMINERAARAFGWTPEEAVGKRFQGVSLGGQSREGPPRTIIGVVEDVYYQPLREPIEPTMYTLPRRGYFTASLKLTGRDLERTLVHIDDVWARIVPEQPVARWFLDGALEALYQGEQRQGKLLGYGAALAIFIACLGLFGLAALTTEQRTKEIGIRRVMGGTIADIVRLLAGEHGVLVLLANAVAWPAAYFLMRAWLDGFAYRVDLSLPIFVGSGLLVLAIAWATVAAVAARAAAAKPIHALRYE
jgi:putative ABC transport system permease protein